MLFLLGGRDSLAEVALRETIEGVAGHVTLCLIDGAEHALHVSARTGVKDDAVLAETLAEAAA